MFGFFFSLATEFGPGSSFYVLLPRGSFVRTGDGTSNPLSHVFLFSRSSFSPPQQNFAGRSSSSPASQQKSQSSKPLPFAYRPHCLYTLLFISPLIRTNLITVRLFLDLQFSLLDHLMVLSVSVFFPPPCFKHDFFDNRSSLGVIHLERFLMRDAFHNTQSALTPVLLGLCSSVTKGSPILRTPKLAMFPTPENLFPPPIPDNPLFCQQTPSPTPYESVSV